ncbi:phage protein Gp27 family protein [Pectobacterium sp. IFB5596]|uniref:phage protein Gp27 family protein n=1 Tax=Pectobacterium sp. IFB5596 TaxID=1839803 RepID=UPI001F2BCA84|nr:phage protein Gp27 family protein [Pectobacterium sp. IFB5596]MCE9733920.1 hypothetical protein [Pectobacterium sp. IFB5596]GKW13520.1 hypothetical protein PEC301899_38020 [Pectobacterium carotovorum subsp. carotovorum]
MGRVNNIDKLPENIREELHKELLRTNFTDYEYLSFWMSEKGYDISKSGIHRYAIKHKDEILGIGQESKFHKAQLRLASLHVAATLSPDKELESLKTDAEDILKWALLGAE